MDLLKAFPMAVYTTLTDSEIIALINLYDIGEFVSAQPIESGIENTNYLLTTAYNQSDSKYILTIFENRVENVELPFFVNLTDHLKDKGLNCPVMLTASDGSRLQDIKQKKAAIISFLEGAEAKEISKEHISQLGKTVAKMHLAVSDFKEYRKNPLSLRAWVSLFEKIGEKADEIQPELTKLIADELYYLADAWPFNLPGGIIHADLFPDNVFFKGEQLSGVIDFYFSCTDFYAYDLAICINAWGIEENNALIKEFFDAYQSIRKLEQSEIDNMQTLLRGAAMRFLLTRIYDWFNTPANALVSKKNPQEYLKKLEYWQRNIFIY